MAQEASRLSFVCRYAAVVRRLCADGAFEVRRFTRESQATSLPLRTAHGTPDGTVMVRLLCRRLPLHADGAPHELACVYVRQATGDVAPS